MQLKNLKIVSDSISYFKDLGKKIAERTYIFAIYIHTIYTDITKIHYLKFLYKLIHF